MGFFDTPPPAPSPMPPPMPRQDWMGPPEGWLGGHVPLRLELARTPGLVALLGRFEAFPSGIRFELEIHSRAVVIGPRSPMGPLGEDMRFGVGYSDGTKWTGFRPPDAGEAPAAPNVAYTGGGGGGNHHAHRLWLWPLPPPGPVTFALAAPTAGIPETTIGLDAEVFRSAATEAEQLWEPLTPEEQEVEHRAIQARMTAMRPGNAAIQAVQLQSPEPQDE